MLNALYSYLNHLCGFLFCIMKSCIHKTHLVKVPGLSIFVLGNSRNALPIPNYPPAKRINRNKTFQNQLNECYPKDLHLLSSKSNTLHFVESLLHSRAAYVGSLELIFPLQLFSWLHSLITWYLLKCLYSS